MTDSAGDAACGAAGSPFTYAWGARPTTFEFFTERYYHQYCAEDCKKIPGNHVRLLQHSNRLCLVCLDPSHVALKRMREDAALTVASVVFGSGRSNNQISLEKLNVVGKKKKNALVCQVDTKLCTVNLSDGSAYAIPACLNGFLLELNEALAAAPWLVAAAPTTEGFLAIVDPSAKNDFESMKKVWSATGGDAQAEDED